MAQITIGFDPEVDDYYHIKNLLDQAYSGAADEYEYADEAPVPNGWTPAKMLRYVRLLTHGGQVALRHMATHAPESDADDVKLATGLDGPQYAGMMSTFGHAARNCRGVHYLPFNKQGRTYYIHEQVAALAIEALDQIGA
jgi:hypothetical protein